MRERLHEQAELAAERSAEEYERRIREQVAERADQETAAAMLQAAPPEQQWAGLSRHLSNRRSVGG